MTTTEHDVSHLIARFVKAPLTNQEHEALDAWQELSIQNQLLVESFSDKTIREKKIADYLLADTDRLWSNLRRRAADETGFELEPKLEIPLPVTPIRKAMVAVTILLGVIGVIAIIYMTVSNIKNHRFPVERTIQQHRFRF